MATRQRRTSSADVRFTFVLLVVGGMILVLCNALVSQLRAAAWTGAMLSGAIVVALAAASVYSVIQRRRR